MLWKKAHGNSLKNKNTGKSSEKKNLERNSCSKFVKNFLWNHLRRSNRNPRNPPVATLEEISWGSPERNTGMNRGKSTRVISRETPGDTPWQHLWYFLRETGICAKRKKNFEEISRGPLVAIPRIYLQKLQEKSVGLQESLKIFKEESRKELF